MQLVEFDFPFDSSLVALQPVTPRDRARLFVVDRRTGRSAHHHVADLPSLLDPGDLVVVNDTKVLAARVPGRKQPTGTPVEVLFVRDLGDDIWEVMVKGTFHVGQAIEFDRQARATVLKRNASGTTVKVESPIPVVQLLREIGRMPLPPYIKRKPSREDHDWYQTAFAAHEGAIAAPTAGLHFTPDLLSHLAARSIQVVPVTLHVGPGTFKPVVTENIEDHQMGAERFEVGRDVVDAIARTKQAGRRVVAIGTTVVRTLETVAKEHGSVVPSGGESRLFITPGFQFQTVDVLMTNFHLPKTTLLMLVSAFAGVELIRKAYEEAVRERYRFYSYGDAMLIL
ncbi:MAG: tRNA preQ1(34) S-adenosylmethionine ribosyltransferase-isomerase QueA [Nitrospira sp.]|nr:tRNA preQ1(34) S-adenosylmethionine ribosyltransferase-isomerase QueA [Nitrospira sp.]